MPTVSDEVCKALERPISLSVVQDAVDDPVPASRQGPDGLGRAFYKTFKSGISVALHRVISEIYENREVPPSFRISHVLIPEAKDLARLYTKKLDKYGL